jgi:hypothetical protein
MGGPHEPEPSIINEKTIADFTRVVEQTGFPKWAGGRGGGMKEADANWGGLTGDKMTDVPFKVGDRVKKRSGYEYPGFIVSVFTNRAGAVRYVVEADHSAFSGMLHIFNGDQLEHR